jgi:hypothetical protein
MHSTSENSPFVNPFKSFWIAGFECTDKLNAFGHRVDFLTLTGHLDMLDEDYRNIRKFNLTTVREGIRWSQVERRPYEYDWTEVERMIRRGKALGIQQVWDICHFGFPDDLTPLHPMFARRFAGVCRAFVQFFRTIDPDSVLIVTPINEVSFLSWLGGDVRGTAPYCINLGWEVKYRLMKAYIEGISAMREIDSSIRILMAEPLVNMVAPLDATPEQVSKAANSHQNQFQCADILTGRICPELGGRPEYLDMLGLNFYYNNQWVDGTHQFLPWFNDDNDPRWRPLSELLRECFERFGRPLVITETGHSGEHRPNWLEYIGNQCEMVMAANIPLWGVCLYPIVDRPDWDHLYPWHGSGLWDAEFRQEGPPGRKLYEPMAKKLLEVQEQLKPYHAPYSESAIDMKRLLKPA